MGNVALVIQMTAPFREVAPDVEFRTNKVVKQTDVTFMAFGWAVKLLLKAKEVPDLDRMPAEYRAER